MLSILVVGAGTMGRTHFRAYQASDRANVAGIVDLDQEKVEKVSNGQVSVFTSFEEAVKERTYDVIDICLPTYLHGEYVKKAADQGAHVICEKPLSGDPVEAQALVDHCNDRGVNLYVGHVVRFFPEYNRAKKAIENGAIGRPGVVHVTRKGGHPSGWENWYQDEEKSGGVIYDLMIHDLDFLRSCFGEVERVFGKRVVSKGDQPKDYALVTLRFKSGVIAHAEASWAHRGFSTAFEFAGDEGIIDYDSSKSKPVQLSVTDTEGKAGAVVVPSSPLRESPYFRELDHFLSCIQTGEQALVTAEDAVKVVEIADAARRSSETGKPIILN